MKTSYLMIALTFSIFSISSIKAEDETPPTCSKCLIEAVKKCGPKNYIACMEEAKKKCEQTCQEQEGKEESVY